MVLLHVLRTIAGTNSDEAGQVNHAYIVCGKSKAILGSASKLATLDTNQILDRNAYSIVMRCTVVPTQQQHVDIQQLPDPLTVQSHAIRLWLKHQSEPYIVTASAHPGELRLSARTSF